MRHPLRRFVYSSHPISPLFTLLPIIITKMDSQSPEAEGEVVAGPAVGSPSEFLKNIVGKRVKVRIGSGIDYHGKSLFGHPIIPTGTHAKCPSDRGGDLRVVAYVAGLLTCLDGYMNVALEETEEYAGGQLTARYGDCFLRGNNGQLEYPCFRSSKS